MCVCRCLTTNICWAFSLFCILDSLSGCFLRFMCFLKSAWAVFFHTIIAYFILLQTETVIFKQAKLVPHLFGLVSFLWLRFRWWDKQGFGFHHTPLCGVWVSGRFPELNLTYETGFDFFRVCPLVFEAALSVPPPHKHTSVFWLCLTSQMNTKPASIYWTRYSMDTVPAVV